MDPTQSGYGGPNNKLRITFIGRGGSAHAPVTVTPVYSAVYVLHLV